MVPGSRSAPGGIGAAAATIEMAGRIIAPDEVPGKVSHTPLTSTDKATPATIFRHISPNFLPINVICVCTSIPFVPWH